MLPERQPCDYRVTALTSGDDSGLETELGMWAMIQSITPVRGNPDENWGHSGSLPAGDAS